MSKFKTGSAVITLANAPDPDVYRPSWAKVGETPESWTRAILELGYCLDENPGPFAFKDIAEATMTELESDEGDAGEYPEGYGDRNYVWEVKLKDGRHFHVEGWHDYTGWGCQDGAEYTEIAQVEARNEQ